MTQNAVHVVHKQGLHVLSTSLADDLGWIMAFP